MIAQIFTTSGTAEGPTEATQRFAEQTAGKQRAVDGCEGIYILTEPSGGDGLGIVFWRDDAAMKVAAGQLDDDISAAKQQNPSMQVSAPRIYAVSASA
jgi:hypothetical protein